MVVRDVDVDADTVAGLVGCTVGNADRLFRLRSNTLGRVNECNRSLMANLEIGKRLIENSCC